MILSDRDILKNNRMIEPFQLKNLQPASVDLRLSRELKTLNNKIIDLNKENYSLKPNEFILGSTIELVKIPSNIVGIVDGKSSLARLGLSIHQTAGYIDSGFIGNITLELKNESDRNIILEKGMLICQIRFQKLSSPCIRPYGSIDLNSHYQNSKGTVLSKYNGEK